MGNTSGLLNSFLAALQASSSVLLVIAYGAIAARLKLLDQSSSKSISKVCVKMFLPALLLTQIGSEMHAGSAHRYGLILLWALICHLLSFLIGLTAHRLLGMPDWITAAIMFNNTTSYPLLLIQSLNATGILTQLIVGDEATSAAISRARSYFLVFSTVSSCLTFAVGPRLIDSEHAPDPPSDDDKSGDSLNGDAYSDEENGETPTDQTSLLVPAALDPRRRSSLAPVSFFLSQRKESARREAVVHDRRPSYISKKHWATIKDETRWWLLFLYDFLNAPLLGAVVGAVIGLVPTLHRAFFSDTDEGGIFTAWLTTSLQNIGDLFITLPVVVAGVSLYSSNEKAKTGDPATHAKTPWLTTAFVLFVRFVLWSVVSTATIYLLARKTDFLSDDPMLWFTMMLMPTGPPAMKLITLVQVSDAAEEDEHKVAKLLTVSYLISPILAITVVASLRASAAAFH